jgi:hypothetical protein
VSELDPEDAKLVTLARATRARTGAAEGAAVRDVDGRTYAAASVALPSLTLSALQVAVAMAASSGSGGLESAAIVGGGDLDDSSRAALRDFGGAGTVVHVAGADGSVRATTTV